MATFDVPDMEHRLHQVDPTKDMDTNHFGKLYQVDSAGSKRGKQSVNECVLSKHNPQQKTFMSADLDPLKTTPFGSVRANVVTQGSSSLINNNNACARQKHEWLGDKLEAESLAESHTQTTQWIQGTECKSYEKMETYEFGERLNGDQKQIQVVIDELSMERHTVDELRPDRKHRKTNPIDWYTVQQLQVAYDVSDKDNGTNKDSGRLTKNQVMQIKNEMAARLNEAKRDVDEERQQRQTVKAHMSGANRNSEARQQQAAEMEVR